MRDIWPALLIMAVIVGFIWWAVGELSDEYTSFMDECMQYRPNYECTALWRAGNHSTTYIHVGY